MIVHICTNVFPVTEPRNSTQKSDEKTYISTTLKVCVAHQIHCLIKLSVKVITSFSNRNNTSHIAAISL